MGSTRCMWCGAAFPDVYGPTHAYMESTPGCWAAFGRVLAREYEDRRYFAVHRLTVDAYAVQHPGVPGRRSIQSVGVHLVRLCLFLERNLSPAMANDAMLAAAKNKAQYHWLEPPGFLGPLTVADVEAAVGVDEHVSLVRRLGRADVGGMVGLPPDGPVVGGGGLTTRSPRTGYRYRHPVGAALRCAAAIRLAVRRARTASAPRTTRIANRSGGRPSASALPAR